MCKTSMHTNEALYCNTALVRHLGALFSDATFLRENPEHEVSVFVWLEGAGHDHVGAGGQAETHRHLSQIDECLGPAGAAVVAEKVSVQRTGSRIRITQVIEGEACNHSKLWCSVHKYT